jgi:hypothetical protein
VNLRSLLMSPAPGCPALRRCWPTGGGIVAEVVGAAGEADRPAWAALRELRSIGATYLPSAGRSARVSRSSFRTCRKTAL